jgi:hypothetical protein
MAQGTTKGVPIDTDITLSLNSDLVVPSQKAVVSYLNTKITGTTNYISKFTGTNTISNSLLQDNSTTLGIGGLLATSQFYVTQNALQYGIYSTNGYTTGVTYGGTFRATGVKASSNVGIEGNATGSTSLNTGISGNANGTGATKNYGGSFIAANASSNYSLRLLDGSEGSGKFLKDVTGNGEARWTNITTSDISGLLTGSGTSGNLTRFVGPTVLGDSVIQDNGTTIGISVTPTADRKLNITTGALDYGLYVNGGNLYSIIGTGTNVGISGSGYTGIIGTGISDTLAVGGKFVASGASTKYSVQLQDGTEAIGKYLKCVGSNGESNWAGPGTDFGIAYAISTGNILL